VLRRNFNIPSVKQSLAEIGFTSPDMILGMFVADLSQKPEFATSGKLNTDDNAYIEYSVPKNALHYTTDANQSALLNIFTDLPKEWLAGTDPETAARMKAEHEAIRLMLEGAVYRAQGKLNEAYDLLERAHKLSPNNPVIRNEIVSMLYPSAIELQNRGQLMPAMQQFQTALSLDPNDFWSLFNMIILNMSTGQTAAAEKTLAHALEIYPESPLMIGLHGKVLFSQGKTAEGLALTKQAAEMHPGHLGLWKDLQMMSSLAGNVDLTEEANRNIVRIEKYINRN
jgi:tetratricopeptide (TPR) repeat protein